MQCLRVLAMLALLAAAAHGDAMSYYRSIAHTLNEKDKALEGVVVRASDAFAHDMDQVDDDDEDLRPYGALKQSPMFWSPSALSRTPMDISSYLKLMVDPGKNKKQDTIKTEAQRQYPGGYPPYPQYPYPAYPYPPPGYPPYPPPGYPPYPPPGYPPYPPPGYPPYPGGEFGQGVGGGEFGGIGPFGDTGTKPDTKPQSEPISEEVDVGSDGDKPPKKPLFKPDVSRPKPRPPVQQNPYDPNYPQGGGNFPQGGGGYPQQGGGYPQPGGGYPQQGGGYPQQGGGYPQQGSGYPQQGFYPGQGGYPGYPPSPCSQQGYYPPGYPPNYPQQNPQGGGVRPVSERPEESKRRPAGFGPTRPESVRTAYPETLIVSSPAGDQVFTAYRY